MNWNSTNIREIRKFGGVALILFGTLCAIALWNNKPIPTYLFGFLGILGLGFILVPSQLRPVYTTWLKVAHLLGRIVTSLILTLAFYLVITPAALIKRLLGGTPLPLKPDNEASSYWVTRSEPAQAKERFLKRY